MDLLDEPRLDEETGQALRVAEIGKPILRDLGFRLVRVKLALNAQSVLQIMAERPDGTFTVEDCEKVSEALSPALDVDDPVKEAYRLEISSPGIDRPLVRLSDFRRAAGHEAKIETHALIEGRKRFRVKIDGLDESGPVPTAAFTRLDIRPGESETIHVPIRDIADGRLVLTDDLIRETLRAAKAAREAAGLPDEDDEMDDAPAGEAEAAPARGPGRFAARNAMKSQPLRPAQGPKRTPSGRPQPGGRKPN